jgi:hypothetical protein
MQYPPEVQEAMKKADPDQPPRAEMLENAQLVRWAKPDSPWVRVQTEEGQRIIEGPPCSSGTERMVHPSP